MPPVKSGRADGLSPRRALAMGKRDETAIIVTEVKRFARYIVKIVKMSNVTRIIKRGQWTKREERGCAEVAT